MQSILENKRFTINLGDEMVALQIAPVPCLHHFYAFSVIVLLISQRCNHLFFLKQLGIITVTVAVFLPIGEKQRKQLVDSNLAGNSEILTKIIKPYIGSSIRDSLL